MRPWEAGLFTAADHDPSARVAVNTIDSGGTTCTPLLVHRAFKQERCLMTILVMTSISTHVVLKCTKLFITYYLVCYMSSMFITCTNTSSILYYSLFIIMDVMYVCVMHMYMYMYIYIYIHMNICICICICICI